MTLRVINISFDCDDVLRVATFWSTVLDRPLDTSSSAEWASIGGTDGTRREPGWYFNKVAEAKSAKNRVHLDFESSDPEFVNELVAVGATVIERHEVMDGSHHWTVLQDPEGNEFCVAEKSFTGFA